MRQGLEIRRRSIIKSVSAGGIGGAFLATKSKIVEGDENVVEIDIDVQGDYTKTVPEDWYNYVQRTRDVRDEIEKEFLGKDAVLSVGYSAGRYGGDNPHVKIGLEKGNENAEERRGEIPEERNDVRIETYKHQQGSANCDPGFLDSDYVPGGLQAQGTDFDEGVTTGENSQQSRTAVGSNAPITKAGLGTALHIWDSCPDKNSDTIWEHAADGNINVIGELGWVAPEYDFVYIDVDSDITPQSEVAYPANPDNYSRRVPIESTLSRGGLEDVQAMDDVGLNMRGRSTCSISGPINSIGNTRNVSLSSFCSDYVYECVYYGDGEAEKGDSGALVYTDPIQEADYNQYAACLHSGSDLLNNFGSAGYAIRDDYNTWWGNGGI